MDELHPRFSVSEFLAVTNQTLEYAYPFVEVEGEVSSFKVNQGKFVFFDIKDSQSSVNCFMMVFQLRVPIEDGMKVIVSAQPRITKWGKFSLTIKSIRPVGEGSLKKSFDLLKSKLDKEGLFSPERKRVLPDTPHRIGVISSTGAAGYTDFITILNERWGGMQVDVAHVQVQGDAAPDQIIKAIKYFNQLDTLPEVLVVVRGGGSADDLAVFNDEQLVRELASSRVPTMVGVGHEVDITLSDMVADRRAATPSNAAELLVPNRRDVIAQTRSLLRGVVPRVEQVIHAYILQMNTELGRGLQSIDEQLQRHSDKIQAMKSVMRQLDPVMVLERGYAIIRGKVRPGQTIEIETATSIIKAGVEDVTSK